jgi:glycosyltransferase involved in cell wall biosynthesis
VQHETALSEDLEPKAEANCELTILLPCLNEAETLATCIAKAQSFLDRSGIVGEILVADNGSHDGSQEIGRRAGARLVAVETRGYGAALRAGIDAARGRYVIMGDADDSYNFAELSLFVEKLRQGYELVMGNRFAGGIAAGAMPLLHRHLGNPTLSRLGRILFKSPIGDIYCGLRGFSRDSMRRLSLSATGMEFAIEMVVKSTLHRLRIAEVPTTLAKDGRSRPPHLRTWRDGWRSLRFFLMYSPRWLFFYPGALTVVVASIVIAALIPGPIRVHGINFDYKTMLVAAMLDVLGVQMLSFASLAKQFGINTGLLPADPRFRSWHRRLTLDRLAILGAVIVGVGIIGIVFGLDMWRANAFGSLDNRSVLRLVILAVTAIIIGLQIMLAGFMSGILDIPTERRVAERGTNASAP